VVRAQAGTIAGMPASGYAKYTVDLDRTAHWFAVRREVHQRSLDVMR